MKIVIIAYLLMYEIYDYCLFIYVSIYKALRNPIVINPQSIKYMYLVYKFYAFLFIGSITNYHYVLCMCAMMLYML